VIKILKDTAISPKILANNCNTNIKKKANTHSQEIKDVYEDKSSMKKINCTAGRTVFQHFETVVTY